MRQHRLIGLKTLLRGRVGRFAVWPMIDEIIDANALDKIGHTADMIRVIVRDQQIIDMVEPCLLHHGHNAVGIAPVVVCPAGIHQQRLMRWSDEERGLATFDVHKIHGERFRDRHLMPPEIRTGGLCLDPCQAQQQDSTYGQRCHFDSRLLTVMECFRWK